VNINFETAVSIVVGVIGLNIIIRIVWAYLENRKHNPGNHFDAINERLQRILDKLNEIHNDIRDLK